MTLSSTPEPARFDGLRSLAFGSIGATFSALGTPFDNVNRILKLVNTTDADVIVTFDGINDNDIVPTGGFVLYDFFSDQLILSKFTQISIRRLTVPTSGTFYAIAVHARGE